MNTLTQFMKDCSKLTFYVLQKMGIEVICKLL